MFTACGIMHRRCCRQAPEDGRNYRPKHVELIEIINKIIIVASSWLFILLYRFHSKYYFLDHTLFNSLRVECTTERRKIVFFSFDLHTLFSCRRILMSRRVKNMKITRKVYSNKGRITKKLYVI